MEDVFGEDNPEITPDEDEYPAEIPNPPSKSNPETRISALETQITGLQDGLQGIKEILVTQIDARHGPTPPSNSATSAAKDVAESFRIQMLNLKELADVLVNGVVKIAKAGGEWQDMQIERGRVMGQLESALKDRDTRLEDSLDLIEDLQHHIADLRTTPNPSKMDSLLDKLGPLLEGFAGALGKKVGPPRSNPAPVQTPVQSNENDDEP